MQRCAGLLFLFWSRREWDLIRSEDRRGCIGKFTTVRLALALLGCDSGRMSAHGFSLPGGIVEAKSTGSSYVNFFCGR